MQLERAQRIAILDAQPRIAAAAAEPDRAPSIRSVDEPHLVARPNLARRAVFAGNAQPVLADPCFDAIERSAAAVAVTAEPGKARRLRKRQARNCRRCRAFGAAGSIA